MRRQWRWTAVAFATAAMCAGWAGSGASALATPMPTKLLLQSTIAPSVPNDPVLHGVTAGSAPWVIKPSALALFSNGDLKAVIKGLVIPALGTPGPVTSVNAAIYCGNEETAAATSASVPLSEKGNAVIAAHVTLPASCLTPVVLINPNGIGSIYISMSGFQEENEGMPLPPVLTSTLAPSVPSDPVLHGVTAGSAPWVMHDSMVAVLGDGTVIADIDGLVIPELGTPGPVTSVDAAIYCGNDETAAATTATAPLSKEGNAFIAAHVKLPASCLTPVVLINPNGIGSIYISASGFPS
jgi:hypothetical protein